LPGQGGVAEFLGKQLANTFFQVVLPDGTLSGGDFSEGIITSSTFTVNSKYINLLVGGGNHPHDPTTSDAPQPAGVLLFPGADLEPQSQARQLTNSLVGLRRATLVNQPVATGAIGGQQAVSGFEGKGLINTFLNGSDQGQGTLTSPVGLRWFHSDLPLAQRAKHSARSKPEDHRRKGSTDPNADPGTDQTAPRRQL